MSRTKYVTIEISQVDSVLYLAESNDFCAMMANGDQHELSYLDALELIDSVRVYKEAGPQLFAITKTKRTLK